MSVPSWWPAPAPSSRWPDDAAAHGIPFRLTLQQQVEYEIVPDVDWTGLRILASAQLRHGATPWRMGAADYSSGLELGEPTPRSGSPAASHRDQTLADAMGAADRAVMEERLIPALTRTR
ncbi:Protein of unknown function C-terminus [Nonomuraea solani]|uniref:DUF2399 domain-containing protein n=1 Tax=Nonomuraea solani TaxID=1144553 RepID=A0A1H6CRF6_9ACTN|nr:DUF2399 domain-containing protein [Nonomuraea solani]SEG75347.1 Protein of unknown function C-terminus [Nonomuraea solani]